MDKLASVFLMGGLGNQLFQLSFANKLRQNGMTVYIDTSNYDIKDTENDLIKRRKIVIPINNFNFEKNPPIINNLLKVLKNRFLVHFSWRHQRHQRLKTSKSYNGLGFSG